jgi:hypothetical protein
MARPHFPSSERALRSRLAKLIHDEPLLRGTLSTRRITCGTSGCHCAKGEKHLCLYLSCSRAGQVEQLFIPRDLEEQVRRWVRNHHTARERLEKLSELSWEKLRAQKARKR